MTIKEKCSIYMNDLNYRRFIVSWHINCDTVWWKSFLLCINFDAAWVCCSSMISHLLIFRLMNLLLIIFFNHVSLLAVQFFFWFRNLISSIEVISWFIRSWLSSRLSESDHTACWIHCHLNNIFFNSLSSNLFDFSTWSWKI